MHGTRLYPNWRKEIQRSALRGRGWALQDLILSPRIVYWTPDGIYWDCCSSIASEFKPSTLSFNEYDQLDPVREMRLQFARSRGSEHGPNVLERWYGIVAHYSRMELSYVTDTLPAISGIAKIVQTCTPHDSMQYAAGIWVNSRCPQDSWFDLAWRVVPSIPASLTSDIPKTNNLYIAPSWSWASAGIPIIYPDCGRQQGGLSRGTAHPCFRIMDVKLHLSGKDTMGQLRSGIMSLRGAIPMEFNATLRATKDPHHWFEQKDYDKRFVLSKRTNFFFDKTFFPRPGRTHDEEMIYQTLLQGSKEEEEEELLDPGVLLDVTCIVIGQLGEWQYGILLEALPGNDKRFRRIGILQRHKTNTFESTKVVDIELV